MLDVHAPENRIEGLRDFFLHLFTITCGLLIALGLENTVEMVHHHHERVEAENSIRSELSKNRSDILSGAPELEKEVSNLQAVLTYVEARSESKSGNLKSLNLRFHQEALASSAWTTAASTGTLRLMPREEVERFAAAYKEQDLLQTMSEQTLNDYLELLSFAPHVEMQDADVTPAKAQSALPYVRHALAHLGGMEAVGKGLLGAYNRALLTD